MQKKVKCCPRNTIFAKTNYTKQLQPRTQSFRDFFLNFFIKKMNTILWPQVKLDRVAKVAVVN